MRYIDKNPNRAAGNQVTRDYLDENCKGADGHYGDIQYRSEDPTAHPDFMTCGSPTYYERMAGILMRDQDNRCCYCLRKLATGTPPNIDAKVTIEHIIPRSFKQDKQTEADEYMHFASGVQDVELTDVFESHPGAQSIPPYPHTVAYENMVVSCNGTFPAIREGGHANSQICCNHKRGAERALPVYLMHDIADNVVYLNTGDVQANPLSPQCAAIDEVIQQAALGCDSLKVIRLIWYELSAINKNLIDQCQTEDDREKVLNAAFSTTLALSKPMIAAGLVEKFKKQDYWDTLMLYDVFYDIMTAKYRTPAPKIVAK